MELSPAAMTLGFFLVVGENSKQWRFSFVPQKPLNCIEKIAAYIPQLPPSFTSLFIEYFVFSPSVLRGKNGLL